MALIDFLLNLAGLLLWLNWRALRVETPPQTGSNSLAGQLKPVVDATFPLHNAANAHRRMEESGQFGKIVLEVP